MCCRFVLNSNLIVPQNPHVKEDPIAYERLLKEVKMEVSVANSARDELTNNPPSLSFLQYRLL